MRICSLLPSATEIVGSLGLGDTIVAVSEECDWPPEVRTLPVVTASRVDTSRLSGVEIDRAVRDAVRDGRPLYAVDREILEVVDPDLILTQNLCTVCAVSAHSVDELCATRAKVVSLTQPASIQRRRSCSRSGSFGSFLGPGNVEERQHALGEQRRGGRVVRR
jgi:iron complex transport system substrate-binding protein